MSLRTNRISIVTVAETVAGTRVEPVLADNDIRLVGIGQPTLDFGTESLGKLADGTFVDGPIKVGQHKITLPDFMFQVKRGSTEGTEPKWFKLAKACGYKVSGTTVKALTWDGVPTCGTLSADIVNYSCTGAGVKYKGRGMAGSLSIKAEGSNAPLIGTVSGLTGAFIGEEDVTASRVTITGEDTTLTEVMGNYICTIGAAAYEIATWEFNPNSEIGMNAANNAQGIAAAAISTQSGKLTVTFLKKIAGDTTIEDTLNGGSKTITILGGTGAGFDFTAYGCQGNSPTLDDSDGATANTVEYQATSFTAVQQAVTI